MRSALLALLVPGLAAAQAVPCGPPPTCPRDPAAAAEVYALCDLPPTKETSHGLSGLVWDGRALLAVRDHPNDLVEIRPGKGWRSITLRKKTRIRGLTDTEGVARAAGGGLLVSDEQQQPGIYRVTRGGKVTGKLTLPEAYGMLRHNQGIEALGTSPDGRVAFFANEEALEPDGPLSSGERGTVVRLARQVLATGETHAVAYRTEPGAGKGGEMGVSDVAGLDRRRVLVLERGWMKGAGNEARIFLVDVESAPDVSTAEGIDPAGPVVAKELVADVATLPECGAPAPPPIQRNRLLANMEGLAIGPVLADGRRLIFLVSDDNDSATQTARLLVLAVRL